MSRFDLIEMCAGTAAVALAAMAAPGFPASRRGSKRGWTAPILSALGVVVPVERVLLVEIDPALCDLYVQLFSAPHRLADEIESRAFTDAREEWARARAGSGAADVLLTIAGSRGGTRDGGFKGLHKLRASVDGFTPTRASLAARVREFAGFQGRVDVLCADASLVLPSAYQGTAVYIDPPYVGRRGYECDVPVDTGVIAAGWRDAGHRIVVSEARPLPDADDTIDITISRVSISTLGGAVYLTAIFSMDPTGSGANTP